MRYVLPRLTVLTGFAALTCVVMPAAFAAIPSPAPTTFGPSGSSIDARCLVAATVRSTASQQGCLERVVTGAVRLRVVVRADPPPSYRIRLLACTALNACNAAISTVVRSEPPPADSPARAMTRLTLTVARAALGPGATRICARQDPFPPLGAPSDAALLGCQAFANDYAGGFEATVGKEGVIVEGWIINPRSNAPVKIEVRRGAMTRTAAARLAYPRSKASFPDFDGFHGFRLLLPFVGRGGSYEICLATPGYEHKTGGEVAGCLDYREKPTVFVDESAYTVGETLRFTAEMLDPGATIRINLFTAVGTFLLPWRNADIASLTADANGHAQGQFSTRPAPPGAYRLAIQCLSGCSALNKWHGSAPAGSPPEATCCESAPGVSSPVTLGPAFTLRPRSRASTSLRVPRPTTLRVRATGLPPNTTVEPIVVAGGFERPAIGFRSFFVDGSPQMRLDQVRVGANGRLDRDLSTSAARPRPVLALARGRLSEGSDLDAVYRCAGEPQPPGGRVQAPDAPLCPRRGPPDHDPARVLEQITGRWITGTGNLGSDIYQWSPYRHFDNAALPAVVCQQANQLWNEFAGKIRGFSAIGAWPNARDAFGALTHATQDFYSHSNWLELGQRTIAPLFPVCTGAGLPGGLQTGYFEWNWTNAFPAGCPLIKDRLTPPVPFMFCHAMLNKDSPTFGHGADSLPEGGRRYHQAAVDLATEHTRLLYGAVRNFISGEFTPQKDELAGTCVADALFGLLPVSSDELTYCRDLSGTWKSDGFAGMNNADIEHGFGAGTWEITQTDHGPFAVLSGTRPGRICGQALPFILQATPRPGYFEGTYTGCLVTPEGEALTGPCGPIKAAPITFTHIGFGVIQASLTYPLYTETETECLLEKVLVLPIQLRRPA